MRAFKILPKEIRVKDFKLSKEALRRLEWMDWYFSHGKNAESTCRHFSISKSVFYRWLNRFSKYNLKSLEGKSTRPHKLRTMSTSPETINLVIKLRGEDLEKSKYEIQAELRDLYGISLGYNTIQKIINRHPELVNTSHSKAVKRRKLKIERIKAGRELKDRDLGVLVQIDTKHVSILGNKFYIFAAIDTKSRLGFTYCYSTISSKSAKDFLKRLIDYFPFKIQAINTDNGSEYLLYFHQLSQELNITHYFSYPNTPKMNSRVERLIQTLEYEFLSYQDLIPELNELRALCDEFNHKYNERRYHQSLHYQTPLSYVKTTLEKGGHTVL